MATQHSGRFAGIMLGIASMSYSAYAAELERFAFVEPHLGTIVELKLYAPDETAANEAARSAYARVRELDLIFSDYKPESEAMRLCERAGSGQPVAVSPELFDVLRRASIVSEASDGAFDVTVGPLVTLWRRARKERVLPNEQEIDVAKKLVDWRLLAIDPANRTVELKRAGMRLDFGGIAKGYIAQEVSRVLRVKGVTRSLVAVAGDIVAGDPPPDAEGWNVGVAPLDRPNGAPSRLLWLENCAISTSGDAYQFVEIEGVRYSHIVDPKTGLGLTQRSSVTVVARDGATADALATAVSVLGAERGLKLIKWTDGVDALIVQATEDGVTIRESKSFGSRDVK